MNDTSTIVQLLYRRLSGELTEAEIRMLDEWISHSQHRELIMQELNDEELLSEQLSLWHADHRRERAARILSLINGKRGVSHTPRRVHRVHFLKTAWFRYAAIIIILFGIGAYLWNNYPIKPKPNTAVFTPSSDILPGGQKATLTLADGRQIILDSAGNGQLAIENGSEVIKRNGEIIYESPPIPSNGGVPPGAANPNRNSSYPGGGVGPTSYNTMRTPNGGQYQLTLSDGTKVWLNAASSITFPTTFNGKTREVKIEGEVYFEVKTNKSKPFIVKSGENEITVLGTSFNINAYNDEPVFKTSLIEGSIKVNDKIIQPGNAYANGKIISTNINQDIAWKNGAFNFNNTTVQDAMRQLARWYNVSIIYDRPVHETFIGEMGRDLSLRQVLNGLDGAGVHFKLEGNILHVCP